MRWGSPLSSPVPELGQGFPFHTAAPLYVKACFRGACEWWPLKRRLSPLGRWDELSKFSGHHLDASDGREAVQFLMEALLVPTRPDIFCDLLLHLYPMAWVLTSGLGHTPHPLLALDSIII